MGIATDYESFRAEWSEGHYKYKVLVEGDSWASHPLLGGLGDRLHRLKQQDYLVWNMGRAGDEAMSMIGPGTPQRRELIKRLMDDRHGDQFDLIFFSLGGNDIIGPDITARGFVFDKRDHPYLEGPQLVTPQFTRTVSDIVSTFEQILKKVRAAELNRATPIAAHVYSYLQPRKVGTKFGWVKFGQGWVAKHLENFHIRDPAEQRAIVRYMLDVFHERLARLEATVERFAVIDTRTTLSKDGVPHLPWWEDEVHPTGEGFKRVVAVIQRDLKARGLWFDV